MFHEDKSDVAEDAEMMRDGGLADIEAIGDLSYGHRASLGRQQIEYQKTGGIAEGPEPGRPGFGIRSGDIHRSSTIIDGRARSKVES